MKPADLTLDGEPFEDTGPVDVTIHYENLDRSFLDQAEKRLKWGEFEAWKRAELTAAKNDLVESDARLGFDERMRLRGLQMKYTERMIEEHVVTHTDHKASLAHLINCQRQLDQAITRRESMNHRRECLIGLGANYRAEGSADPILLREAARQKAVERESQKQRDRDAKTAAKQPPTTTRKPPGKKPPGKRPPGKRPPASA